MAYKNKILSSNGCLQLIQSVNERGGKKYLIKNQWIWNWDQQYAAEELFSPFGNNRVSNRMWKFSTRKEAEELLNVAVLKGISRYGR